MPSVVADEPRIFARNVVAEPMLMQQSNITAVTSVVDNLPGAPRTILDDRDRLVLNPTTLDPQ